MSARLHWRILGRVARDVDGVAATVAGWPGLRAARHSWLRHRFVQSSGVCWGVFETFAQAVAAAPGIKPVGYDHPAAAAMYRPWMERLEPKDYAVAFWLRPSLRPGAVVFDFGGHVGVKYYAMQQVMAMPDGLRWIVHDVPAVLAAGRALANERQDARLEFTDRLEPASGADAFLALGSLQYVETPLARLLSDLERRPRAVTVSSVPMSDHPRYVTLQNIGTSFCPYLVENRRELQDDMARIGYRLVHSWTNPEKEARILDRPDRSVQGYTSMHFELDAAGAAEQ
jgi:putative methyltransferase (TIGR04325 family)